MPARDYLRSAGLLVAVSAVAGCLRFGPAPHGPSVAATLPPMRTVLATDVVGLGDSVPAAANCGCASYIALLARSLSRLEGTAVTSDNQARNGLTSAGLLTQVKQSHTHADPGTVTVVTIGANDFDSTELSAAGCSAPEELRCYGPTLASFRRTLDELLTELLPGLGPRGPVLVTGYWNIFLDGGVGSAQGSDYVRDSDALTQQVNATIEQVTRSHRLTYVDLYEPFKQYDYGDDTALLADDGDHPSAAGHVLISTVLLSALPRR